MSNTLNIKLAKVVQELRSTNTAAWNEFMALLAERLDEVTEKCIASTPEALVQNQGRALEARELFRQLDKAPKLAQELHEKERQNGFAAKPQGYRP